MDCFAIARNDAKCHAESKPVILRALARRISCKKRSFGFHPQDDIALHRCISPIRHCDERSEEAIQERDTSLRLQMTNKRQKAAFTLAEVLITLGIIGVIAALTLPGLLAEYSKLVVETKLKKFYSQINQAIQLSEAQYGAKEYWYSDTNSVETDADGNPIPGSSTAEKWFMKYIGSHMTVIKVEYDELARPTYFFKDGTALKQMNGAMNDASDNDNMRDWTFYTAYPDRCLALYGSEENARGRCAFPFLYISGDAYGPDDPGMYKLYKYHYKKDFEPYKWNWDGDIQTLKNNCKGSKPEYCTAWIQLNGWKIPDDYPYKVSY